MAVTASKCVPVTSRWVNQLILTCDDELAIQFRNGFCCVYPGTTGAFFDLALVWGSPGKFIHRWLYKKRPYRPIRNPCPGADCSPPPVTTTCCGNPLPGTLHGTLVDNANCPDAEGGSSIPLVYNSVTGKWEGTGAFGVTGRNVTLKFYCGPAGTTVTDTKLDASFSDNCLPAATGVGVTPVANSCSPLSATFSISADNVCGCGINGDVRVVITE